MIAKQETNNCLLYANIAKTNICMPKRLFPTFIFLLFVAVILFAASLVKSLRKRHCVLTDEWIVWLSLDRNIADVLTQDEGAGWIY